MLLREAVSLHCTILIRTWAPRRKGLDSLRGVTSPSIEVCSERDRIGHRLYSWNDSWINLKCNQLRTMLHREKKSDLTIAPTLATTNLKSSHRYLNNKIGPDCKSNYENPAQIRTEPRCPKRSEVKACARAPLPRVRFAHSTVYTFALSIHEGSRWDESNQPRRQKWDNK